MPRKKTKAQEFLEAKVTHKYGGKIDLKELWKREGKELDSKVAEELQAS